MVMGTSTAGIAHAAYRCDNTWFAQWGMYAHPRKDHGRQNQIEGS